MTEFASIVERIERGEVSLHPDDLRSFCRGRWRPSTFLIPVLYSDRFYHNHISTYIFYSGCLRYTIMSCGIRRFSSVPLNEWPLAGHTHTCSIFVSGVCFCSVPFSSASLPTETFIHPSTHTVCQTCTFNVLPPCPRSDPFYPARFCVSASYLEDTRFCS